MQRRLRGILFSLGVGLAGAVFVATPFGLSFEERFGLSWLFYLRGPVAPPHDVAIVGIDEQAAIDLGVPSAPRDWPRSLHGQLVDALVERGADVIAFDLAFIRPQAAAEDAAFADAIARSGRVLLFETNERRITPLGAGGEVVVEAFTEPQPVLAAAALGVAPLPLPNVPARISRFWTFLGQSEDRVTLPALALLTHGLHYDRGWLSPGWVDPLVAPADAEARRQSGETRIDLFATALRRRVNAGSHLDGLPPLTGEHARRLRHALLALYTAPDAHYLNFYGPPGTIRHVSFARLLACRGRTGPSCEFDLDGSVVFVGLSELSKPPDFTRDAFVTVFARRDGIYLSGVEIAATAFANLLTVSTLQPPPPLLAFGVVLLLGCAFGLAAALLPPLTAVPSTLLLAFAYALTAQLLFAHPGLWLPLATPMAQLPVALLGGIGSQLLLARRQQLVLRRAKEAAEAASAAKTDALRIASHDIRTPVQAMISYLEQFRATPLDATQRALLERVLAASDTLLGMLNTVLDLAAIEAGKMRIVEEAVNLRRLAHAEIDILRPQADAKGLLLTLEVAGAVPERLLTDPLRLQQIVSNLLSNAIKFTDRGHVRLHVELLSHAAAPGAAGNAPATAAVAFSVIDSGMGIAADVLATLFQPFQRGSSEARQRPGSGLGLSIAQRLAELLGGAITVISTPGQGSIFRLELPARLPPTAGSLAMAPAPSWGFADAVQTAPLRPHQAPLTALVVDDDPTIRALLRQQLSRLGLTVHLASDGAAGWLWLQKTSADILVTDYRLPRLDGPTLIRRVRADARLKRMRIIALTADTAADIPGLFASAGADLVLWKPVTHAGLAQALQRIFPPTATEATAATAACDLVTSTDTGPSNDETNAPPPVSDAIDALDRWPDCDPANILATLGHDPHRLGVVIDAFCRQTGDLVTALTEAAAQRDATAIARIAHRVAGTSLSFGAIRLGEACRALERAAANDAWPSIERLVGILPELFTAAAAGCQRLIAAPADMATDTGGTAASDQSPSNL